MKIITLTDNNSFDENLRAEHGFSVYIETENHKILFDTGQSDAFLHNANQLNVNLKEIDSVVISHGHYDHLGGLILFLQINNTAKVYLKKEIFDYQYLSVRNDLKKKIGYPENLKYYENRFVFIDKDILQIDEMIFFSKINHSYPLPKGNGLLYKTVGDEISTDDFLHELIFAVEENDGLCIVSGCAHNGILNMLQSVKTYFPNKAIKLIYGGLHLIEKNEYIETETDEEIKSIAKEINTLATNTQIITGHCTGKTAFETLKKVLPNQVNLFYAGSKIEI